MDRTAPECSLRLEWVYGYRGHQVRSNLFYNDHNEIVYFVAGIGIVHNYAEQKQRFFLGHDDDIISLAMHPDKVQIATGQVGKSPQIIVWSSKTLEATSICKGGHTDGVGILTFDKSGEKLASCGIDQDSTICVWDWKKGKLLAKSFGHQEKAFDLQFSLFKENSLVSVGVKTVNFWSLMGNTLQKKKGLFGDTKNMQTMFCLGFGNKEKETYYTGSMDGRVFVWKENKVEEILPGAHNGAIYCMLQLEEGGFITAGKDGRIRSWDPNFAPLEIIDLKALLSDNSPEHFCIEDIVIKSLHVKGSNLLIGTQSSEIFQLNMANVSKIDCVCKGHAEGELWSLACSSSDTNMIATASDDQTVRIWNIKTKKLVKIVELEKKVRSCAFNKDSTHLACGLSDGTLVVLNTSDMSTVKKQKIRGEVLHEMKYSPCGMFLAVGSNENYVDVFSGKDYKKVGTCSGNSSFITHLDWSKDSQYIQTNSGDGARLVYKIPSCKQFTTQVEIDKIVWHTFTGVLGNEVVGIWEKYTNKTDVNATDCNFEQQCMATGDDFGLVKLFRYPSLKKGAKFRKYVGHSSHVTNVRFTHDKTRLISIGGADHAIFQWRFIPDESKVQAKADLPVDASAKILPTKEVSKSKEDDIPEQYQAYMDSNSEDSDSEMSGREVDSDIEREKEISYDRTVYKTDLIALKPRLKEELKKAEIEQGFTRQVGPEVSLALEFVYGYRGYDCRDNLFYIHESGEIVYHVAALGIVYNKETQIQKFYDQHTDDILALCLHPIKAFVATGQIGRDPPIHVWDIETMKTLSVLKGEHERGICSVNFSSDGKKLASVGLDDNHCICVWDWRKGEKLATTRGNKEKIFCIKWNPHNNDKLVTVGVKHIKFWNQVGAGFTSNRGLFGKLSSVDNMMCITFGKTPDLCYTGGSNGSIYVWKEAQLIKLIPAHQGPIFSIYAHEKWEAYVTGGKDGSIILWNGDFNQIHKYVLNKASLAKKSKGTLLNDNPSIRAISLASKKILIGTKNGEIIDIDKDGVMTIIVQGHGEGEVWGLACHPTKMECCTASDDKTVRLWTIQEKSMHMIKGRVFDKLARSCQYSPNGQFIVVGFKEGAVVILKSDTLELVETISHRTREISDLKFSPVTGKYLAVASHEDLIDIYNVDTRKRVGICKGASSYITHVEWDVEGKLIAINSGAKEILYFEMPRGNRVNINSEDVSKITWATFTSVLGPTCSGIWQPCMDVTDINTTDLSHDRRTLATGDDFGLVKLFNYPCPGKFSKFKRYMGHSSHVTMVRWTFDDSCLLSIGGNDTSLMIWRNMAFEATAAAMVDNKSETRLNQSSIRSELVLRNSRKGESEDSETDSEDEGYDSDVKREHVVDYTKNIFKNEIQRPSADLVQQMYKQVKDSERIEKSKPSRMVKSKLKRTKVTKMKGAEGKEIDPLTLLHVMAKISAVGAQNNQLDDAIEVKQDIKGLKLSHVHGYRGFDCRDNVFYVNEGAAIVFPAAAAGIVHDLATNTQSFYLEHTDDIISLIVNENPKFKNVVATGQIGANPVIRIWDALTKDTLSILSGLHKSTQGVCSLDFSSSGKLLLSVGLDKNYTIGVWRWKEGTLVASASADRYPNRVFRAAFRPDSDTTFVSVGFKHIQFWSVAGSELVKKKGVLTDWDSTGRKLKKMPTMLSLGFGQDNVTYTGTMSGDIYVWKENVLARAVLRAHTGPIFSMYTSLFDGCILTGAKEIHTKDSAPIKLWDKDMKKVVKSYAFDTGKDVNVIKAVSRTKNKIIIGTKSNEIYEIQEKTSSLQCLITTHGEGELWGLAVHPSKQIFITGSYECFLKVWDVPTKKVLKTFDIKVKVRSIDIRFDGTKLVVGSAEGDVILYELNSSFDKIKKLDMNRQRKSVITDVKFSPKKNYVAAGSDECYIDFYEITEDNTLNRVSYCKQVPGPILQMDWSTSGEYIKVGTTNYCTVVYQAPKGNQIKEDTIHDSVEWNHWTSIFGAEVIGIWPSGAASNFINCAHLASASGRLAVGDDDGAIKLYKFPCPEKDAQFDVYYGHSSNITNVKFICTNTHLISIGADDFCVFVWECI